MTLIEGIGDEVTNFFILIAIVVIALVAWWSTNISERPLMRTVLILERRTTRHSLTDTQTALGEIRDSNDMPSEPNQLEVERKSSHSDGEINSPMEVNVTENYENVLVETEEAENTIPSYEEVNQNLLKETKECPESCGEPNEMSVLRKRTILKNSEDTVNVSKADNENLQNIMDESSTSKECELQSFTEGKIRIKLKYLNDDQKLVEGKLQEPLGEFKKRHFSIELSRRKLVRLIFNGKVLQQDSMTLQNYGFFDNCVVHCLVHQPRTPPPSPNLNRPRESQTPHETTHHHWDLGNILFASLSFLLGLAWYGRYQYAQLYTATTTVALIGLTGMFTVSLIGMYMPDVDGIRT